MTDGLFTEDVLSRFVEDEAALLDDGRYDEWLALFASDGHYWVPLLGARQADPHTHNSIAYEDRLLLPRPTAHSKPSWFGFVITVREDAGFSRDDLVRYLEANRIETRSLFAGNLLRHPAFADIPHRIVRSLVNTDTVMTNTFFIGVYPGLDAAQLDYIEDTFAKFIQGDRVHDIAIRLSS